MSLPATFYRSTLVSVSGPVVAVVVNVANSDIIFSSELVAKEEKLILDFYSQIKTLEIKFIIIIITIFT